MGALSWFRDLFASKAGRSEDLALTTETFWRAVCRLRQPVLLMQAECFKILEISAEVFDLFPEMTSAEIESALRSSMTPSSKARLALAASSAMPLNEVPVALVTKSGSRSVFLDVMPVPEYPCQSIVLVRLRAEQSILPEHLKLWREILTCVPHPAWILSPSGLVSYSNAAFLQWPLSIDEGSLPALSSARHVLGQLYQKACETNWMVEASLNLEDFGNWHVLYFPLVLSGNDGFVVAIAFSLDVFNLPGKSLSPKALLDLNQVFKAREEERASISREIHDSLGQELTVLKLELRRLSNLMKDSRNSAAEEIIEASRAHVDRLSKEARRIAYELRQDTLAYNGLVTAVQTLVLELKTRLDFPVQLTVAPRWREPAEGMAHHIYRIVQELLNNVSKHARASRCMVKMGFEQGMYWVEVRDDGVGFPTSNKTASLGLNSLNERARMFGGTVSLKTRPEVEGTLVRLELRERSGEGAWVEKPGRNIALRAAETEDSHRE